MRPSCIIWMTFKSEFMLRMDISSFKAGSQQTVEILRTEKRRCSSSQMQFTNNWSLSEQLEIRVPCPQRRGNVTLFNGMIPRNARVTPAVGAQTDTDTK